MKLVKSFNQKLFAIWIIGWNDIKSLATRYKQLFPHIFEDIYDKEKFSFRYTDVQRTEASYKSFVEG